MSQTEVLLFTGVLVLLCVAEWRLGILITLFVGFASDPVRKLVPGEPVYLTAIVVIMVTATLVGFRTSGYRISLRPLLERGNVLRTPLLLFILLVFLQSLAAYARTGNATISLIGLIAYLAPIPGILLAHAYASRMQDVHRFFRLYVLFVVAMASGIYLARLGYNWPILRSVGEGLIAFSPSGERLVLQSGFFRAPEVAAWHIAMAMCLIVLLYVGKQGTFTFPWLTAGLLLALGGALMFTGRRKALVEIVVFLLVYFASLAFFRRAAVKTAMALVVLAVGIFVLSSFTDVGNSLGVFPYYERGVSIGRPDLERVENLTVHSLRWVVARNGILGAGAGTGSQGAQHFGGGSSIVGAAAEGGLGKVLAELGVPGLILILWLGVAGMRYMWGVARRVAPNTELSRHTFGIIGLIIANASMYAVAHQVFGDPFVLFILGMLLGFVLATPRLSAAAAARPIAVEPVGSY